MLPIVTDTVVYARGLVYTRMRPIRIPRGRLSFWRTADICAAGYHTFVKDKDNPDICAGDDYGKGFKLTGATCTGKKCQAAFKGEG